MRGRMEPDRQWAWWDEERQRFRHVYPSKLCVEMCFPDGGKSGIAAGRGRIVQVEIRETPAKKPEKSG
jgi:hypothetical protein